MVHIYVSQLRKLLPAEVLRTRPPGYSLHVEPGSLDLDRFAALREAGRAALAAAARPATAAEQLREALALWRGAALAEFSEPFARVEAARLEELQLACLEDRIEADIALGRQADAGRRARGAGRPPSAARAAARAADAQPVPLRPPGRGARRLPRSSGRRSTSSSGWSRPSALRDLERRILQQDPALGLPAAPRTRRPAARAPRTAGAEPAAPRHGSTARRASCAAATCRSPTRCSATARSTWCSSTAGCAASTRAGSASRSRASTAAWPRWAG